MGISSSTPSQKHLEDMKARLLSAQSRALHALASAESERRASGLNGTVIGMGVTAAAREAAAHVDSGLRHLHRAKFALSVATETSASSNPLDDDRAEALAEIARAESDVRDGLDLAQLNLERAERALGVTSQHDAT